MLARWNKRFGAPVRVMLLVVKVVVKAMINCLTTSHGSTTLETRVDKAGGRVRLLGLRGRRTRTLRGHVGARFRGLSGHVFRDGTRSFAELGARRLNGLLHPLNSGLGSFHRGIRRMCDARTGRHFSLNRHVGRLIRLGGHLDRSTGGLAHTLGKSSGVRNG